MTYRAVKLTISLAALVLVAVPVMTAALSDSSPPTWAILAFFLIVNLVRLLVSLLRNHHAKAHGAECPYPTWPELF